MFEFRENSFKWKNAFSMGFWYWINGESHLWDHQFQFNTGSSGAKWPHVLIHSGGPDTRSPSTLFKNHTLLFLILQLLHPSLFILTHIVIREMKVLNFMIYFQLWGLLISSVFLHIFSTGQVQPYLTKLTFLHIIPLPFPLIGFATH